MKDIHQTSDGGYIVANGSLIKTDTQGNEEWINANINVSSLNLTTDGGFICVGEKNENIFLMKTNSQGQFLP